MVEASGRQTHGVRSRLGGYYYECHVATLRFLDVLSGKAEFVQLETTYGDRDHFDDIKVFTRDEVHAYQVKWGMYSPEDLTTATFFGPEAKRGSDLRIGGLLATYRDLRSRFPGKRIVLHMYTTRRLDPNDNLHNCLQPAMDPCLLLFADEGPAKVHVFDPDRLAPSLQKGQLQALRELAADVAIEVDQLQVPYSTELERSGYPMRELAMHKIAALGISQVPISASPVAVFDRLLRYSLRTVIYGDPIDARVIEGWLELSRDAAAVEQHFPYDHDRAIVSPILDRINTLRRLPAPPRIALIVGPPGAGKSWALTQLAQEGPIHYCFIAPQDAVPARRRAQEATAIHNLIREIRLRFRNLSCFQSANYGATREHLETVLSCLAQEATGERPIPVIVDGLDHAVRESIHDGTERFEHTVMDLLLHMPIPDGIMLVVGTQRVAFLDTLEASRETEITTLEMPPLTYEDVRELLTRGDALHSFLERDVHAVINLVLEKSGGLPLYVHYIAEAVRYDGSRGVPQDRVIQAIRELPRIENRDIEAYYEYLWNKQGRFTHAVLASLSLIDFPITRAELETYIYPPEAQVADDMDTIWRVVAPLLLSTADGYMLLFHASFRRFIQKQISEHARQAIATRVAALLRREDFYLSDRAFRYLWQYLRLAGCDGDVCARATLEVMDEAIRHGRSETDTAFIWEQALRSAAELSNPAEVCRLALLYSSIRQRYANLPPADFTLAAGVLGETECVERFISRQAFANLDDNDFLHLLEYAAYHNWTIDGVELLREWFQRLRDSNSPTHSIDERAYVRARALWHGAPATLRWIREQVPKRDRESLIGEVYIALATARRVDDLKSEYRVRRSLARREALRCLIAAAERRGAEAPATLADEAITLMHCWRAARVGDFLMDGGVVAPWLPSLLPIQDCLTTIPGRIDLPEEAAPYDILRTAARAMYCAGDAETERRVRMWLGTLGGSLFGAFARLAVATGRTQAQGDRATSGDLADILSGLRRIVTWRDERGVRPSSWELRALHGTIQSACLVATALLLRRADGPWYTDLLTLMHDVASEQMSSAVIDLRALITDAIDGLGDDIDAERAAGIREIVASLHDDAVRNVGYENERATAFLRLTRLWTAVGAWEEGRRTFETAIRASFAHEWHKDYVLFSLTEFAAKISEVEPLQWRHQARDIARLIHWVDLATDGDETSHLPSELFELVNAHSVTDAVHLLRRFQDDPEYHGAYRDGVAQIAGDNRLSPQLRFALAATLPDMLEEAGGIAPLLLRAWRDARISGAMQSDWMRQYIQEFIEHGLANHDRQSALQAAWDDVQRASSTDLEYMNIAQFSEQQDSSTPMPQVREADEQVLATKLRGLSAVELVSVRVPHGSEALKLKLVGQCAQSVSPEVLLEWAEIAPSFDETRVTLLRLAAERFKGIDHAQAIRLLVEAFSDANGWNRYFSRGGQEFAQAAMDIDADLTIGTLCQQLALDVVQHAYWGRSGFEAFGELLVRAGRIEAARELFGVVVAVCDAMFRTFPRPPDGSDLLGWDPPTSSAHPEHEVLVRRLLVHELDIHKFSIIGLRLALKHIPGFIDSVIDTLAHLESTHGRTAALTALRWHGIDAQQQARIGALLREEGRLPVLLEARRLGVRVTYPPIQVLPIIAAAHDMESTWWDAVMRLAQEEFDAVVHACDDDPIDVRRALIHNLATTRWNHAYATDIRNRYLHPNYPQIPFESVELQLLMDALYRWAAGRYPALSVAQRRRLDLLVTHDDVEFPDTLFAGPPPTVLAVAANTRSLQPTLVNGESWTCLAMERLEQPDNERRERLGKTRYTHLMVGVNGGLPPNRSIFQAAAISKLPRVTRQIFRSLPGNAFYAAYTGPSIVAMQHNLSLFATEPLLFTLTELLRTRIGLRWRPGSLDLEKNGETVVRFHRWARGFNSRWLERTWRDRGASLEVRTDLILAIEAAVGSKLTAFVETVDVTTAYEGTVERDEESRSLATMPVSTESEPE